MCQSESLVYRRVPLHLLLHHLHHKILYSTKADTPKIHNPKEVEIRVRSYGETRCIHVQKPKTQMLTKDARKYKAIYCMTRQTDCRISKKLFFDERSPSEPRGNPEHGYRDIASSSHELPMESRANVELGSGKRHVFTHFPKKPNCDICLKI